MQGSIYIGYNFYSLRYSWLDMDKKEMNSQVWVLYQLVVEYALRFCSKSCYDLLEDCQEYILERVSRNDMKRLSGFEGRSSESTFAYVVTRNLVKDFLKTKKDTVSYDESHHDVQTTPRDPVLDSLVYDEMHDALQTLDAEDQLIMKLRYFDEYPVQEIADLFHKTPKQLSKKIETIKKKLRRMLDA